MKKRIISLLLILALVIGFYQPQLSLAATNSESGVLAKDEIDNLLGVDKTVATNEQVELFFENLPELLELDDNELGEKLESLELDNIVELSDEPTEEFDGTSTVFLDSEGNSLNTRMLVPNGESFHADFTNRVVTSQMFNVDLYFYNQCKSRIAQFAGYVYFEFERTTGSWMTLTTQYINEVDIAIGKMKIHAYSFQHNNSKARYIGDFVVVYKGTPYVMARLTENK